MAYRFKTSKYRNATPQLLKKEECMTDFQNESPTTNINGKRIAASKDLLAFCSGGADSGNLSVFPLSSKGRLGNSNYGFRAHNDTVTDIKFSPFHHNIIATASTDQTVKIWDLNADDVKNEIYPTASMLTLNDFDGKPEVLGFHPEADNVLGVASSGNFLVYDLNENRKVFDFEVDSSVIQSCSWGRNNSYVAVTTKSGKLMLLDPRNKDGTVMQTVDKVHDNMSKGSHVLWLKEGQNLITTGFSSSRERQVKFWDIRSAAKEVHRETCGSGTSVLIPVYDEDTCMLFVSAKGDSSITYIEIDSSKTNALKKVSQHMFQQQTFDICLAPKYALDTLSCEVCRVYQLSQRQITPLPWIVPRRAVQEFPSDLFPDTASDLPSMSVKEWLCGANVKGLTCSLNPTKLAHREVVKPADKRQANVENKPKAEQQTKQTQEKTVKVEPEIAPKPKDEITQEKPKVVKAFTGVRASKFRHWKATVSHQSKQISNVQPISLRLPVSCDIFKANEKRGAVPLAGSGGKLAIVDLNKPGRMTEDNSHTLTHDGGIAAFAWNPFNDNEVAVGTDMGDVYIWDMKNPETQKLLFEEHENKITALCYHPLAENIIASCSVEGDAVIWNSQTGKKLVTFQHDSEILCMAWSSDGCYLATVAKDTKLRVFDPFDSEEPLEVGEGVSMNRACRMVWVDNDKYILLSTFTPKSERLVTLHRLHELDVGVVASQSFSTAPSVFVPSYDCDSNVVFLTGKGDSLMFSVEIDDGKLYELSSFKSDLPHQAFDFLNKKCIDPRKVEFLQAWRLGKSTLDHVSITVPRVKMEYFQDDIFPDTAVTWQPTLTATEWMKGVKKEVKRINLRPSDMILLSEAPAEAPKTKKFESYDATTYKTDEEKKEELLTAMSGKLDLDKELEQDTMDGVDEDEWDDY